MSTVSLANAERWMNHAFFGQNGATTVAAPPDGRNL
jgi:hypothetical protein